MCDKSMNVDELENVLLRDPVYSQKAFLSVVLSGQSLKADVADNSSENSRQVRPKDLIDYMLYNGGVDCECYDLNDVWKSKEYARFLKAAEINFKELRNYAKLEYTRIFFQELGLVGNPDWMIKIRDQFFKYAHILKVADVIAFLKCRFLPVPFEIGYDFSDNSFDFAKQYLKLGSCDYTKIQSIVVSLRSENARKREVVVNLSSFSRDIVSDEREFVVRKVSCMHEDVDDSVSNDYCEENFNCKEYECETSNECVESERGQKESQFQNGVICDSGSVEYKEDNQFDIIEVIDCKGLSGWGSVSIKVIEFDRVHIVSGNIFNERTFGKLGFMNNHTKTHNLQWMFLLAMSLDYGRFSRESIVPEWFKKRDRLIKCVSNTRKTLKVAFPALEDVDPIKWSDGSYQTNFSLTVRESYRNTLARCLKQRLEYMK